MTLRRDFCTFKINFKILTFYQIYPGISILNQYQIRVLEFTENAR